METLEELTAKYSSENIWKMDKSGCFFKALPDKGFVEKAIKQEVAKIQSKNHDCFFVDAAGKKNQLLYGRVECHVVLEN